MQLVNPCLHSSRTNLLSPRMQKNFFEQPIIFNQHTKLNFTSNNSYFYSIQPKNITDKFTIIRDLALIQTFYAPFSENYAKLYFDVKQGVEQGIVKFLVPFFQKNVFLCANMGCCNNFLDIPWRPLQISSTRSHFLHEI